MKRPMPALGQVREKVCKRRRITNEAQHGSLLAEGNPHRALEEKMNENWFLVYPRDVDINLKSTANVFD